MNETTLLSDILKYCRLHPVRQGNEEAEKALWADIQREFSGRYEGIGDFGDFLDDNYKVIRAIMTGN